MTRALLFLMVRSFRNRLLSQLRRLKRPRYLVFAIVGGTYFYFVAGRHWVNGLRFAGQMRHEAPPTALIEAAAALFILGSIVVAWCAPSPVSPLTFSEAEIQYLFPAPVSRRSLVKWKLMRGQLGVLVSLVIFTAVSGPWLAGGSRLLFFAGGWLAFATMQLHLTGIRMARHTLQARGIGWAARSGVAMALAVAAAALCAFWAARHVGAPDLAALGRMRGEGSFPDYVSRVLESGPAWALTLPARLVVRPALATDLARFFPALPVALALLAANYVWVLRSGVVLQEGALAAARHQEELKEAHARGRLGRVRKVRATPAPFKLSPIGTPEVALVWKNLICALRNVGGLRTFLGIIAACLLPALLSMIARGRGAEIASQLVGMMCAVTALVLLLVGPSILRSDFRQDLPHIDLLKTYPLSGRSLLVGTLLAPVIVLTVMEWGLLVSFALFTTAARGGGVHAAPSPVAIALAGAILAFPMNMIGALVHNAALLIVPGWVSLGPARTTGVERIGQGMITTLGFMLAMALSFLPAAIIFGAIFFFASGFIGNSAALIVSSVPAAAGLLVESAFAAAALGAYLDRFDPSRELDALSR